MFHVRMEILDVPDYADGGGALWEAQSDFIGDELAVATAERWERDVVAQLWAAEREACSPLAARRSAPHESDAALRKRRLPPLRVLKPLVAAIDDDVARPQQRRKLGEHGVHLRGGGER